MQRRKYIVVWPYLISAMLMLSSHCYAQSAPGVEWQNLYGGRQDDVALDIQQTRDGGYVVVGTTNSNDDQVSKNQGHQDYWIIKLDPRGRLMWQQSYGGSGMDEPKSVVQTFDGGYVVAGSSVSGDGDLPGPRGPHYGYDYWVLRLDSLGNVIWKNCYGGSYDDLLYCVQQTKDSGFILSGYTSSTDKDITFNHGRSDYWLVKLATDGSLQWQKCFGGTVEDFPGSVRQCPDGGYIVAGTATSYDDEITGHHGMTNNLDWWVVKIDSVGNILWEHSYGGSADDYAWDVQCTLDGCYVVVGWMNSTDGDGSGLIAETDILLKLDSLGDILWKQSVGRWNEGDGGAAGTDLLVYYYPEPTVVCTFDSGYALLGGWIDNRAEWGAVTKLDPLGNKQWTASLLGLFPGQDDNSSLWSLRQTSDSGFVLAGTTNGDFLIDTSIRRHGSDDFWVVKLGFIPQIFSSQKISVPRLKCESDFSDTLWISNIGARPLRIDSSAFTGAPQFLSVQFPAPLPLIISSGDSIPAIVKVSAPPVGQFTSTLNIFSNDSLRSPWPVAISGRKDSIRIARMNISNDTLDLGVIPCATSTDSAIIILQNYSSIYTTCSLQTSPGSRFHIDSTASIPAVALDTLAVHFAGDVAPGLYRDSLIGADVCGKTFKIFLSATIDSATIAIAAAADTIICPNDSVVRNVLIKNSSRVVQQLILSGEGSQFPTTTDSFSLDAGDSAIIEIHFQGASANGIYAAQYQLVDRCGGVHAFAVHILVDGAAVVAQSIADTTICTGVSVVRRVLLQNISGTPQQVKFSGTASVMFSISPDSLTIAPGDSAFVDLTFLGSPINGVYAVSYDLPSGCGVAEPLSATVRVDNGAVTASVISDTTICPGDSILWIVKLHNVSADSEHLQLANAAPGFSIKPSSTQLAAGDSTFVTMIFAGAISAGNYSVNVPLPGCGGANAIAATVHVSSPAIDVPATFDTVLCPFTPLVFTIPISNRHSVAQSLTLRAAAGVLSREQITLAPRETDTVQLSIIGQSVGDYMNQIVVADACGIQHTVAIALHIRTAPPLQLSLRADAKARKVGEERTVYLFANPITAMASGSISCTITNEATALEFDSITSHCNASVIRGMNTNTISFNACIAPTSDTIATLYYNTLVGSTLVPTVTLENVQTANTCDTVSGAGFATINLLPPGCELGTVIVHPFTSAINSIYPNPATGITTVTYSTVENANLTIDIRDLLGRIVHTLVHAVHQPGVYTTSFDPQGFANGLYYLSMKAGATVIAKEIFIMQ